MTGDYTKVPLRPDERWTGARMQQARVLLDHEWNLNLDADAQARADQVIDVIGPAGVAQGSPAFEVAVTKKSDGTLELTVGAGHMWVGGLEPHNPTPFPYSSQDQVPPLRLGSEGNALVYLDVFAEHVQPAEDPAELVDPALAAIDSAARTRVGWRVRVAATTATSCADALAKLDLHGLSDATVSIFRAGPAMPADPCAPPGDPLGLIPDGLFRLEVLDSGTPGTPGKARLAWAFDDGASAVAVATISPGSKKITLAPSVSVKFAAGDLVEISWLARRADRVDHGPLYTVVDVAAGAGGDELTLERTVGAAVPHNAAGLCVRRWDGQTTTDAAATAQTATRGATDLGVRFQITGGKSLLAGDWWGSRLRQSATDPVEIRKNAFPDGTRHSFCPLAMVDLAADTASDCRPSFDPLVGRRDGAGVCTVTVRPGEDLQAAFDKLPPEGGEVCLAAGLFPQPTPVMVPGPVPGLVTRPRRIVLSGVGPASVVRAIRHEAAIIFDRCTQIEVRSVRIEGGAPRPPGDKHLNGALTFLGCTDIRVADCDLACPSASGKAQACLTVRAADDGTAPDRIRIEDNRIDVGAWQIGMLLVDSGTVTVSRNHVRAAPPPIHTIVPTNPLFLANVARLVEAGICGTTSIAAASPASASTSLAPSLEPGAGATGRLRIQPVGGSRIHGLVTSFAQYATPQRLQQLGSVNAAARRFVRSLAGKRLATLASDERGLNHLAAILAPGLQGIVVAGYQTGQPRRPTTSPQGTIQILDNLVEGVIQGIHIGASQDKPESAKEILEQLDEVMVARNIIHLSVPFLHPRERHAIFVGNARTIHILDTIATLDRPDHALASDATETPVEAIRVYGQLGPFLIIRHTSTKGFHTGVTVWPLPASAGAENRIWLVAETMAAGGHAVNLPQPIPPSTTMAPNSVNEANNIGDIAPPNVGSPGVPPS